MYSIYYDALPLITYTCDHKGKCTYFNKAWTTYTDGKGTLTDGIEKYVHPDDLQDVKYAWWFAVESETLFQISCRLKRYDGKYIWHACRSEPITNYTEFAEDTIQWIGTCTDIEESLALQRKVEEKNDIIEKQNCLVANTLEQLPKGVAVVSADAEKILYANKILESFKVHELYKCNNGVSCQDWDGYHVAHADFANAEYMKQAILNKVMLTGERATLIHKDGHEKMVSVESSPVLDKSGEVVAYVMMCEDYDKKVEKQSNLQREREAIEANQFKSNFIANMSHEMRTPIHGIIGISEILIQTNLNEQQKCDLKTLKICAENLGRLVDRILDLSKLEAGKMEIEQRVFSLKDVISETVLMSKGLLKQNKKNIIIVDETDGDIPNSLVGDPTRIRQIYTNIMNNSIKFTSMNGSITIKTTVKKTNTQVEKEDTDMEMDVKKQSDSDMNVELLCSISDTGVGIKDEHLGRLFKPFSQADSSTTRKHGGSGLGLSICKELISLMKGEISISSAVGKGTTVSFRIPLQKSPVEFVDPTLIKDLKVSIQKTMVDRQKLRIMLVEDNEVSRHIAQRILIKSGYDNLESAENGEIAVRKFMDRKFDVILLDCQMPVMDGFDAARRMRQIEVAQGITTVESRTRIYAFTASATQDDKNHCIESGMDLVILKPVNPKDLIATLDLIPAGPSDIKLSCSPPLVNNLPNLSTSNTFSNSYFPQKPFNFYQPSPKRTRS